MLSKDLQVKVTKVSSLKDPYPHNVKELDPEGPYEQYGVNDGYTIQGTIIRDTDVGDRLAVLRTNRNGITALGVFNTSPVQSIMPGPEEGKFFVSTENSVYLVEKVVDDPTQS